MSDLTASQIFEEVLPKKLQDNDSVKNINAIFMFNIDGPTGGVWTVDLNKSEVSKGEVENPDCILAMQENHFIELWEGKLNGMKAMMTGKLRIKGNMALATKLQAFIG